MNPPPPPPAPPHTGLRGGVRVGRHVDNPSGRRDGVFAIGGGGRLDPPTGLMERPTRLSAGGCPWFGCLPFRLEGALHRHLFRPAGLLSAVWSGCRTVPRPLLPVLPGTTYRNPREGIPEVEVIPVWRVEPASPPAVVSSLPELPDEGPDRGVREGRGLVSHTQVNRQSGTDAMEGRNGSFLTRIERRLHRLFSVPANDPETWPHQPSCLAFKQLGCVAIKRAKSQRKAVRNTPSSRHSLSITRDPFRPHRPAPGQRRKGRSSSCSGR